MSRDAQVSIFRNLNGGLDTRSTPLVIESGSEKKMLSPALRNVDFFRTGSIAKRLGKTKQGDSIPFGGGGNSILNSQTTITSTDQSDSSVGGYLAIAQKFVPGSSVSIPQVTVKIGLKDSAASVGTSYSVVAEIWSNSGGVPSVSLGTSNALSIVSQSGSNSQFQTFIFSTPVAVTSGTTYWMVIKVGTPTVGSTRIYTGLNVAASDNVVETINAGAVWATPAQLALTDMYFIIYLFSTSSAVQGVYDYRFSSASTQKAMVVADGAMYAKTPSAYNVGSALVSGLSSGQDNLWAFATLKDYLFSLDNGNNPGRVWNGAASYTTKLGFQATFTPSDGGAGALADGVYKILAVTTLISGGYRASAVGSVTLAGGGSIITVGSIVMDGTSASNFGFDISTLATKWFMTAVGADIYYKIPTGNMSTGTNPNANNVTTFNITAVTGLTTANTLLDEYGLEQAYFTTQTASPTGKYLAAFNNMLCMGGDANYPSRIWFSGIADGTNLAGPQIWGMVGGLYGNYRDLEQQDGEVIVGLKEWNGNLYAFKRHSVFLISFTGVAGNPFEVRRLSGNLGALSHWSIKETQRGLVFISERGPCICTGTSVSIIPAARHILDRFDLNNTTRYNLAAMAYTTAGNNSTKMQISWGVSSTSATTRDLTLVYDYENDAFWENDVSANYYGEVTDSNFFPSVWSGDYSAQVFRHDYGTTDNGSAISFYFETPNVSLGKPYNVKTIDHLFVSGAVQSSGTLTVEVYTDFSDTVTTTCTFDMSKAAFAKGMNVPLNLTCSDVRFKFSNSALSVPVQINSFGIGWQDKGLRV